MLTVCIFVVERLIIHPISQRFKKVIDLWQLSRNIKKNKYLLLLLVVQLSGPNGKKRTI